MEIKYDSVTINGIRLPDTSISYAGDGIGRSIAADREPVDHASTLPLGRVLGRYTFTATMTLEADGWQKLCNLIDRLPRGRWDHRPAWLHPLYRAHEGGGNARQRRKRLRAAYREAMKLRAVEPAP